MALNLLVSLISSWANIDLVVLLCVEISLTPWPSANNNEFGIPKASATPAKAPGARASI